MKTQFTNLLIFLVVILATQSAAGATLEVPHDYYSIKDALFHAQRGDHIQVAPGRYYEINLTVPPSVTLTGMGHSPSDVVIDGQQRGRIMLCESLDATTVIQNITFTNGRAEGSSVYDQCGGAILLNNSTIRLINCDFINNSASSHGGALRCSHASPHIIYCRFTGNTASNGGGGAIDCSYDSSPLLQSCFLKMNEANWGGALSCRGNSSPVVYDTSFDRNIATGNLGYGGAVMADHEAFPNFEKCSFYGNSARYGGALACFENSTTNLQSSTLMGNISTVLGAGLVCSDSYPVIENSIIAFQEGSSVACGGSARPTFYCTNIFGNEMGDWSGVIADQINSENNISLDPLFCNLNPDLDFQFYLQDESPCTEENSSCSAMGAWPEGCSITPIYINNFTANWANGVPRICWSTDDLRTPDEFLLIRALDSDPSEETPVRFIMKNNGFVTAYDYDLPAHNDQNLLYSLYLKHEDLTRTLISQAYLNSGEILKPLALTGTYPNPFNPRTTIKFETSHERLITVTVHNVRGQKVKELASRQYQPGMHELVWNGVDSVGRQMESGTYFVTVRSNELITSQKIQLIK